MAMEMELVGVRVQVPSNAPIVLLRETAGRRRILPIFIGGPEAHAIDLALSGTETPRPMTHDLFQQTLEALGATLERIVVTELKDRTFFAELHLRTGGGETTTISSRPSDAIALAVRTGSPILAEEAVLEEAGVEEDDVERPEEEQLVEELRRFLDVANPDDFASGG
jgi:bifunctional DNase/RNase